MRYDQEKLNQRLQKALEKYPDRFKMAAAREVVEIVIDTFKLPVSDESLDKVSAETGIAKSYLYKALRNDLNIHKDAETATTYVAMCAGLPCKARGCDQVNKAVENWLGIKAGEHTIDRRFFLDVHPCLFKCTHAPALQIDDHIHEEMLPSKAIFLLQQAADKQTHQGSRHNTVGKNPYKIGHASDD